MSTERVQHVRSMKGLVLSIEYEFRAIDSFPINKREASLLETLSITADKFCRLWFYRRDGD